MRDIMEETTGVNDDGDDCCFRVWLGGLSPLDVTPSAWELEEVSSESKSLDLTLLDRTQPLQNAALPPLMLSKSIASPPRLQSLGSSILIEEQIQSTANLSLETSPWFRLAFDAQQQQQQQSSGPGGSGPPSVAVVDLSKLGRGNALVTTQRIKAGQVIYTERAAVATQMPTTTAAADARRAHGEDGVAQKQQQQKQQQHVVRACQYCFRSLEPISSCRSRRRSRPLFDGETVPLLPRPELWPVPEMECLEPVPHDTHTECDRHQQHHHHDKLRRDKLGRVQCQTCELWFCCLQCHSTLELQLDSCCLLQRAVQLVTELYSTAHTDDDDDDDDTENLNRNDEAMDMQPAIPLAIRMFALRLRDHRSTCILDESAVTLSLQGLCGEASNAAQLELGAPSAATTHHSGSTRRHSPDSDNTRRYTLDPVYAIVLSVYCVSLDEQAIFSLEFFTTLAVQAARNGFGIKTQSPFKPYYSALLRTCLDGRGSPQHEDLKRRVARALGSDCGDLKRGMDRIVEDMVCPEIIALFPLTSRINHACQNYTAQVQSQQFVDCHIDVVAVRDMERGEEITISYIYTGRKNTHRRRRELEAKYLFVCECSQCVTEL